jgi:predicted peptidase
MVLRIATLLFAALVVIAPSPSAAQEGQNGDPLDKWRIHEPESASSEASTGLLLPSSPATSIAPAPSLPPPSPYDKPRIEKPLEDYTEYFERRQIGVGADKERHTLTYFFKAPKTAALEKKFPLVLVLHDAKGIAQAAEHLIFKDAPRNFPAFIAVPVLPQNKIWSFPEEFPDEPSLAGNLRLKQGLPDAVELVAALAEEHPIDRRRVYVIGCGDGGFGAFGAARRYADIFAAAIPINGAWALKESTKMTQVPLFIMHGEENKTVPSSLSQNVAFYVQKFGGKVWYLTVPDLGNDCGDRRLYTKTLWEWLFSQHK